MIRSELLRVRYALTGKVILTILLAGSLFIGLLFAFLPHLIDGLIALNNVIPNATSADQFTDVQLAAVTLANPQIQRFIVDILGNMGTGTSLPVIAVTLFGALTITGEFRHGSITNAVLEQPIRTRLILGKATALVIAAVAAAILLIVVQSSLLAVGLVVQHEPLMIDPVEAAAIWGRGIAALALYSLLGMGIGLLIRTQVITISVLFAVIVVESIVRPLALLLFGGGNPTLFLPFGLAPDIIVNAPLTALGAEASLTASISSLAAIVTLLLWTCTALVFATIRFVRADIPGNG